MPRFDGDDVAVLVRYDLRLDGVAFLFARVKLFLHLRQTGPGNRGLEAVH